MNARLFWPVPALALIVVQTTAGGTEGFLGVHPDFLLLAVLWAGMRRGETPGALWGILLGFLQDIFSAGVPGMNILTKGLCGFAAGILREQLDCDNPNTQSLLAVIATLAEGLAQLLLLQIFSADRAVLAPFLSATLPAAAAHGVLLPAGPALLRVLGRLRPRSSAAPRAGA